MSFAVLCFYSAAFVGHFVHWGKKYARDGMGISFFSYFFSQNKSASLYSVLSTLGAVTLALPTYPEPCAVAALISAFSLGYVSDSAINNVDNNQQ